MTPSTSMNSVQRSEPFSSWPPPPAAQTGKPRLDEARNQGRQFDIGAGEDRSKGRANPGLLLARYGFARAVLDPTLFAQSLPPDDGEAATPDFSGRKRYAQTITDRQIALPAGEVLDLLI